MNEPKFIMSFQERSRFEKLWHQQFEEQRSGIYLGYLRSFGRSAMYIVKDGRIYL
jgi:hypothetical protein